MEEEKKKGLSRLFQKLKIKPKSQKTERHEALTQAEQEEQAGQPEASTGPAPGKAPKKVLDTLPKISKEALTNESINSIVDNIRHLLNDEYCVVGGLAYSMRGSGRGTADADIWVRKQDMKKAKIELGQTRGFHNLFLGNRDDPFVFFKRSHGKENHNVDILVSTDFAEDFPDLDISKMTEKGSNDTNLPLPQVALALKILAWLQHFRAQYHNKNDAHAAQKVASDTTDINFGLRQVLAEKKKKGHDFQIWDKLQQYCDRDFMDTFEERSPEAKNLFEEIGLRAKK